MDDRPAQLTADDLGLGTPAPEPPPDAVPAPVKLPRGAMLALGTLALLAVFATLYVARAIVLPFVLAIVLSLLLAPAMRFLNERLRVPRPLAALLLIFVLLGVVAAIVGAISVPASGWLSRAPEALPQLQQRLGFLRGPIDAAQHAMQQLQGAMGGAGDPNTQTVRVQGNEGMGTVGSIGAAVLSGTRDFLGQIFTIILLLFFFLSGGDSLLRRLVEVLPTLSDKKRTVGITQEVGRSVSGYLVTITLINLVVGTLNGVCMWLCGSPDPLLWGTVAFLLNYIPILGPLTGVVIFFFVGLLSFGWPGHALIPAGVYLTIHLLEGEGITPILLARRFTMNPVLVMASLVFWDWMWGVPGAFLAVPLLGVMKIVCDRVPVLMPLGHVLGTEPAERAGAT